MSLEQALGYIDQASKIPSIGWISISGGEPFLFPEMLRQIISSASKKGLHSECVTNCFWAETEIEALKVLQGLKDAGLEVINLSTDDFHQAQLPFSAIRNCYRAARKLDLKPVIMSTVSRSSKLTLPQVVRLLGDPGIHILKTGNPPLRPVTALGIQNGFLPVGRGGSIPEAELMVGESPLTGPCRTVFRDISISPSGTIRPCCSAGGLVPGMELGNADSGNLARLVSEAGQRDIFRILAEKGPEGLKRLFPPPDMGKEYVNKCHLCYEMLRLIMGRSDSRQHQHS